MKVEVQNNDMILRFDIMAPSHQLLLIRNRRMQLELLITIVVVLNVLMLLISMLSMMGEIIHKTQRVKYTKRDEKRCRLNNLNALIVETDIGCRSELRMNRHTLYIFVIWLEILGV